MKTVLMALVSVLIYSVAIFSPVSAREPAQAAQGSLIKVADDTKKGESKKPPEKKKSDKQKKRKSADDTKKE